MKKIENIRETQLLSLDILKFVDKICKENNIKYSLAYGTALGAVRHGGFIPWDDDIDLMMTRENYNKFLQIMETNTNSNYNCISFPDLYYKFAKVNNTNTYVEETNQKRVCDMGVNIDIFPVDYVNPKTSKKDHSFVKRCNTFAWLSATTKYTKSSGGAFKTIVKFLIRIFAKLFGWKFWIKKAISRQTKWNKTPSNLMSPYDATLEKAVFDASMFENLTTIKFEDAEFPIFKDYDNYLKKSYGDYMKLPPKEKQIPHPRVGYYKNKQD